MAVKPAGNKARTGGRHASQSPGQSILKRHGSKFTSFSLIGGGVFVAGLALQAALTGGLHVPSFVSYLVQAVVSVEASYFLNRWITWRGVKTPFWGAFWRFNLQKVVTVTVNLTLYAGLLKLGINYLAANILLTAVFTVVNYVGADCFVFLQRGKRLVTAVTGPLPKLGHSLEADLRPRQTWRELPMVSVVIPCRGNEKTIRAAVDSILGQDYPMLRELILVGSPDDSTWAALADVRDRRLFIIETETPPGVRDANFKRDLGIRRTSGDLVSLIDSDMLIPQDWMSNAVQLLMESRVDCVAGVMRSIRDDFWGRFVDNARLAAKTPRARHSYLVTAEGFGVGQRKPPITANILFTREMYERCPIDSTWSHGSLEDYEWFWRVVAGEHEVMVSGSLYGWHHHRAGLKKLAAEYRRSARGCAYFIRAHGDSPFARKRLAQAIFLPAIALAIPCVLGAESMTGHGLLTGLIMLALAATAAVALSAREFVASRTFESLVYPLAALVLGANYTVSLVTHLLRNAPMQQVATSTRSDKDILLDEDSPNSRRGLARLWHPLSAILVLQATLSLTLVWSNTAFNDEAEYLWAGHLEIAHWRHGISLPTVLTNSLSGSPVIYPPLGAIADSIGGLVAARLLSLVFTLISTILLYSAAKRLIGEAAALFAAVIWVISEPTMRLGAFATFDALSILLTALSVWLTVRAAASSRRGEHVAVAAVALALANADAYSSVVMDPVVIAFIFFAWMVTLGARQAFYCTCWLVGTLLLVFVGVMTASHSWAGIMYTIFLRGKAGGFNNYQTDSFGFVLKNVWIYSGLDLVLTGIGLIVARSERRARLWLIITMAVAALIVPITQLHYLTAVALDKHLGYGIFFAAMIGGYGCQRLIRAIPRAGAAVVAICTMTALAYPISDSWQAASYKQLSWGNATAFIKALKPVVATTAGDIDASVESYVARYYTSQGYDWSRWSDSKLPLTLKNTPAGHQVSTYSRLLQRSGYSVIALFYTTTIRGLPASVILTSQSAVAREKILNIITGNNVSTATEGQAALTVALENDSAYHLVSVGPFNTSTKTGIFAIWARTLAQPVQAHPAKVHEVAKRKAVKQ